MKNNSDNKSGPGTELENEFEDVQEACQACGGELKAEKVNLEEFENGKLYLMENVASFVCQECGEVWVPEPIIKEFEKMMATVKEVKARSAKQLKQKAPALKRKSQKRKT